MIIFHNLQSLAKHPIWQKDRLGQQIPVIKLASVWRLSLDAVLSPAQSTLESPCTI